MLKLIYEIFELYYKGDELEDLIMDIELLSIGQDNNHWLDNFIAIITLASDLDDGQRLDTLDN